MFTPGRGVIRELRAFIAGRFNALVRFARSAFADPVRGLRLSLLMLAGLIALATLVYMLLEGMAFTDALYMTVITITTVGFSEIQPLSTAGRIFTILLILLGVGTATSAISNAIGIIAGPRFWLGIRRRNMERQLMDIENHYIVCGYGRIGQQVIGDLRARQQPFLVVDLDLDEETMLEQDMLFIIGDATQDETLLDAGIERAAGLVAALDSDADNMMTVLTARVLNPRLYIVARVTNSEVENKLRRAGANAVISPYQIGGHRLALALLRPAVSDFLDRIFRFASGLDADVGQIYVQETSRLAQQSVGSCELRQTHQINILAIQRESGELIITPGPNTRLEPRSTLIVIGPPDRVYELEREYGRNDTRPWPGPPPPMSGPEPSE